MSRTLRHTLRNVSLYKSDKFGLTKAHAINWLHLQNYKNKVVGKVTRNIVHRQRKTVELTIEENIIG